MVTTLTGAPVSPVCPMVFESSTMWSLGGSLPSWTGPRFSFCPLWTQMAMLPPGFVRKEIEAQRRFHLPKRKLPFSLTTSPREGQCDNNRAGRNNANNVDLNRNFPRQFDEPVSRLKVNGQNIFHVEAQKIISRSPGRTGTWNIGSDGLDPEQSFRSLGEPSRWSRGRQLSVWWFTET